MLLRKQKRGEISVLTALEKVVEKGFYEYVAFKEVKQGNILRTETNSCTAPEQSKNIDCSGYWEKTGVARNKSMGKGVYRDQIVQYLTLGSKFNEMSVTGELIDCSCCNEKNRSVGVGLRVKLGRPAKRL